MTRLISFRPGFSLGVSLGALQCGGSAAPHTWQQWAESGHIRDGSSPCAAYMHFAHRSEDVYLMRSLGIRECMLGVSWADAEPEEGSFDETYLQETREELLLMIGLGIRPLLVIHDFADPLWFDRRGGWRVYDNIRAYLTFVQKIVSCYGHLVSEYLTFRSPNVYVQRGYVEGTWPPGIRSWRSALEAASNLAGAHIKAYRLIHDMRRGMGFTDTKVSCSLYYNDYVPRSPHSPADRALAAERALADYGLLQDAMLFGRFHGGLRNNGRDRTGLYADFHAAAYGTRVACSPLPHAPESCIRTDLGVPICPDGITAVCRRLTRLAPMPIYITGNDVCDVNDSFRARFIADHLSCLADSALAVRRYYGMPLLDGFHHNEGRFPRTGLAAVSAQTGERTLKRTAGFYAALIRDRGETPQTDSAFVEGTAYHR